MDNAMKCPACNSEHAYQDRGLWVCPECAHEWSAEAAAAAEASPEPGVRDINGNLLADGDSVIVIKDLKVKGSSSVVKGGTKVRNIRLTEATDGHNIACKIDGIGAIESEIGVREEGVAGRHQVCSYVRLHFVLKERIGVVRFSARQFLTTGSLRAISLHFSITHARMPPRSCGLIVGRLSACAGLFERALLPQPKSALERAGVVA